jgi:hypothetical protein
MVTIHPLTSVDSSMLQRLITGYETDEIYCITTSETDALTSFDLRLTPVPQRFVQRYAALAQTGRCFAAHDASQEAGSNRLRSSRSSA